MKEGQIYNIDKGWHDPPCPLNHEQMYWQWRHKNMDEKKHPEGFITYECPPCPKCNHDLEKEFGDD